MPFEPGYIEPAAPPLDADGDLLLDESLASLAGQLRREALELAERFPADGLPADGLPADGLPKERADSRAAIVRQESKTVSQRPTTPARMPHVMTLLSLAAIGLLSAAGAFLWLVPMGQVPVDTILPRNSSPADSVSLNSVVSSEPGELGEKTMAEHQPTSDSLRERPIVPYPLRVVPVGLSPAYSGPQWEGVLDLMEAEQTDEPSVAI